MLRLLSPRRKSVVVKADPLLPALLLPHPASAPVLLERKLLRILKTQDAEKEEHRHMHTLFQSKDRHCRRIFAKAVVSPFALFVRESIMQLLGLRIVFVY